MIRVAACRRAGLSGWQGRRAAARWAPKGERRAGLSGCWTVGVAGSKRRNRAGWGGPGEVGGRWSGGRGGSRESWANADGKMTKYQAAAAARLVGGMLRVSGEGGEDGRRWRGGGGRERSMPSCQARWWCGGCRGCNLWAAGVKGLDLEVADDALPVTSGSAAIVDK